MGSEVGKREISYCDRCGVFFDLLKCLYDSVRASLECTDELMHVQDCFARLLHSAWLDKQSFYCNPRARLERAGLVRERIFFKVECVAM